MLSLIAIDQITLTLRHIVFELEQNKNMYQNVSNIVLFSRLVRIVEHFCYKVMSDPWISLHLFVLWGYMKGRVFSLKKPVRIVEKRKVMLRTAVK